MFTCPRAYLLPLGGQEIGAERGEEESGGGSSERERIEEAVEWQQSEAFMSAGMVCAHRAQTSATDALFVLVKACDNLIFDRTSVSFGSSLVKRRHRQRYVRCNIHMGQPYKDCECDHYDSLGIVVCSECCYEGNQSIRSFAGYLFGMYLKG